MAPVTNLQDTFLNHLRRNKVLVTVFLVNGVKLQGMVSWFDQYSVLLRRRANVQLLYKHAGGKGGRLQGGDEAPRESTELFPTMATTRRSIMRSRCIAVFSV